MARSQFEEPLLIDDVSKHIFYSKDLDEINEDFPYLKLPGAYFVPLLGVREWDGHVYITGATGAGKSYMIRKIVDNDKKKRGVILFTNLKEKDPVFNGMNYVKFDKNSKYNVEWLQHNDQNKIMIFDDTLNNKEYTDYRDRMLEEARKKGTTVLCVNHKLQDYNKTKVALTDARFVICFPNANTGQCFRFLKNEMGVPNKEIQFILNTVKKDGRPMIIHRFTPNFIASAKSIFRI